MLLWATNLCSISASIFCYIYLSNYVYRIGGGILYSDAVLMAPMVIPVLLCVVLHRMSNRWPPRSLLIATNVVGLLVCLAVFNGIEALPWLAIPGCLIIGTLDAIQRISRVVAVKQYLNNEGIKQAVPLTMTAQFIAGGLAGVTFSLFNVKATPMQALAITSALYAVAALAAGAMGRLAADRQPKAAAASAGSLRTLVGLLRGDAQLRFHFITFVAFITVFQGFFNVSRVALPAHELNLPERFVGILQAVNSFSALVGALAFFALVRKKITLSSDLVSTLCAIAMVGAVAAHDVGVSYTLYFAYIFLFELVFFKYQSDLVTCCPANEMPLIATFQYAGVYLGMIVSIAIGGVITQYAGLFSAGLAFGAASIGLTLFRYAAGRMESMLPRPLPLAK